MNIYILTIPRNINRLQPIINDLNTQGANYNIFNGIDYKSVSHKFLDNIAGKYFGNLCPYPTLACAASHILLWKHIFDNEKDSIIVLEDDTTIDINILKSVKPMLNGHFTFLYNDLYMKILNKSFVLSFGCYCISPETAGKLYNYYSTSGVDYHIDFINNFVMHKLNIPYNVVNVKGLTRQINGNTSSMGIFHKFNILYLFKNTYFYRICTTPAIRIFDITLDLYRLVYLILILIILIFFRNYIHYFIIFISMGIIDFIIP